METAVGLPDAKKPAGVAAKGRADLGNVIAWVHRLMIMPKRR